MEETSVDNPLLSRTEPSLSGNSLLRILEKYVLRQKSGIKTVGCDIDLAVFLDDDGEKLIELIMEINPQLKMYGSAKELTENLKSYSKFPGTDQFHELSYTMPIYARIVEHKSLGNDSYISKQDLYSYYLWSVLESVPNMEKALRCSALSVYFKLHQHRVNGCHEFVKLDKEEIKNVLYDVFRRFAEKFDKETSVYSVLYLKDYSIDELHSQWKLLFPFDRRNKASADIRMVLEKCCSQFPLKNNVSYYQEEFDFLHDFFECLEQAMDSHPNWFLPYTEEEKSVQPLLRMFSDGSQRFVMLTEVFNVCKTIGMLPKGVRSFWQFRERYAPEEPHATSCGLTMSYEEFIDGLGNDITNLEVVEVPIERSKNRAVPFLKEDGTHCLLAADVLLETLRELIWGYKVFQMGLIFKESIYNYMLESSISFYITSSPFYMDYKSIEGIYQCQIKHFSRFLSMPGNDVRLVNKEGFTVEDLKSELKYLKLNEYFPDITNHAERVYDAIVKAKKGERLGTSDMYDAVEQCQLACIFRKNRNLAMFLHSQNACNRVFYDCEFCPKKSKNRKKNTEILSFAEKNNKGGDSPEAEGKSIRHKFVSTDQNNYEPRYLDEMNTYCKAASELGKLERELRFQIAEFERFRNCSHRQLAANEIRNRRIQQFSEIVSSNPSELLHETPILESVTLLSCLLIMRDRILETDPVGRATADVSFLINLTELDSLKRFCTDELAMYLHEYQTFMDILENNIQIMREHPEMNDSDVPPLSTFPSFSDEYLNRRASEIRARREADSDSRRPGCSHLSSFNEVPLCQRRPENIACAGKVLIPNPPRSSSPLTLCQFLRELVTERGQRLPGARALAEKVTRKSSHHEARKRDPSPIPICQRARIEAERIETTYRAERQRTTEEEFERLLELHRPSEGGEPLKELEDMDCLLCLKHLDDRSKTLKCIGCYRRYHSDCVEEWFKTKQTCPACGCLFLNESDCPNLF